MISAMEEVSPGRFLDSYGEKDIPVFFIYDRTAALEEDADQKEAVLYPALQQERLQRVINVLLQGK